MAAGKPHVLVIPFPMQGHVLPFMEVSRCLVQNGLKVTFVNTDFNHKRLMKALASDGMGCIDVEEEELRFVSIPDAPGWEDYRMDLSGLWESLPRKVEELINSSSGSDEITCVMTELLMGQALEVAVNMKVKRAIFFPASAAMLATSFNIPKLIDDGVR